ncbi:MAG: hypothetical protein ACK5O2_00695 [Microthrixaceae bacterium]
MNATVKVLDESGTPAPKARVTVAVEYLDAKGVWRKDSNRKATTGRDGTASVRSKNYWNTGNAAVKEIRLTITAVDARSKVPWDPSVHPTSVSVKAP